MLSRPNPDEHDPYYARYIDLVGDGDVVAILARSVNETKELLAGLDEEQSNSSYAPGKWTVKQVLGHMIDSERVFSYRALRIARNDRTPLPGFEQDDYVAHGPFTHCALSALLDEFAAVRRATVLLFEHLYGGACSRRGTANSSEVTVRAIAYIIAGHELHHRNILKTRYFARTAGIL
jgi:uncharacterized damage-inducible protein DinB